MCSLCAAVGHADEVQRVADRTAPSVRRLRLRPRFLDDELRPYGPRNAGRQGKVFARRGVKPIDILREGNSVRWARLVDRNNFTRHAAYPLGLFFVGLPGQVEMERGRRRAREFSVYRECDFLSTVYGTLRHSGAGYLIVERTASFAADVAAFNLQRHVDAGRR